MYIPRKEGLENITLKGLTAERETGGDNDKKRMFVWMNG